MPFLSSDNSSYDLNNSEQVSNFKNAIDAIVSKDRPEKEKVEGNLNPIQAAINTFNQMKAQAEQKKATEALFKAKLLSNTQIRNSDENVLQKNILVLEDLKNHLSQAMQSEQIYETTKDFFSKELQKIEALKNYAQQELMSKTWEKEPPSLSKLIKLLVDAEISGHRLGLQQEQTVLDKLGTISKQLEQDLESLESQVIKFRQGKKEEKEAALKKLEETFQKYDVNSEMDFLPSSPPDLMEKLRQQITQLESYKTQTQAQVMWDRTTGDTVQKRVEAFQTQSASQMKEPKEILRNKPEDMSLAEIVDKLRLVGPREQRQQFIEQAQIKASALRDSLLAQYSEIKQRLEDLQEQENLTETEYKKNREEIFNLEESYRREFLKLLECQKQLPELLNGLKRSERSFFTHSAHEATLDEIGEILLKLEGRSRGKENIVTLDTDAKRIRFRQAIYAVYGMEGEGAERKRVVHPEKWKVLANTLDRIPMPTPSQISQSKSTDLRRAQELLDELESSLTVLKSDPKASKNARAFCDYKLQEITQVKRAFQEKFIAEQTRHRRNMAKNPVLKSLAEPLMTAFQGEISGEKMGLKERVALYDYLKSQINEIENKSNRDNNSCDEFVNLLEREKTIKAVEQLRSTHKRMGSSEKYQFMDIRALSPQEHSEIQKIYNAVSCYQDDEKRISEAHKNALSKSVSNEEEAFSKALNTNVDEYKSIKATNPQALPETVFQQLKDLSVELKAALTNRASEAIAFEQSLALEESLAKLELVKKKYETYLSASKPIQTVLAQMKTTRKEPELLIKPSDIEEKIREIEARQTELRTQLSEIKAKIAPPEKPLPPSAYSLQRITELLQESPEGLDKNLLMEEAGKKADAMRFSLREDLVEIQRSVMQLSAIKNKEDFEAMEKEINASLEIYKYECGYLSNLKQPLSPLVQHWPQSERDFFLNVNGITALLKGIRDQIAQQKELLS